MTSGNKAIQTHKDLNKALVLFQATKKKGDYLCVGEFECVGWRDENGLDRDGKQRKTIVFELLPITDRSSSGAPQMTSPSTSVRLADLRDKAYQSATIGKTKSRTAADVYVRSEAVKAYVRARAAGICEACKKPAPFISKLGQPYLEPHHIDRLADGGLDKPDVVGAICPTCHREIHHGENGHVINASLRAFVQLLEESAGCR